MHVADRPLVPALANGAAYRAAHRLADGIRIATARLRQRLERRLDRIAGNVRHGMPGRVDLRNAEQFDLRIGDQHALIAQRQRHGDEAGETEPAARSHSTRVGADQERAVLVEPA